MNRIVAVTGATGFAGRHAIEEFLKRGWKLRALVRDSVRAKLPPRVETVSGDLHNGTALDKLLEGADAIVHLAGAITALRREDYFRINAQGTEALAQAARRARTPRFVHVSSLSARMPDLSDYGASKRAGEDIIASQMTALGAVIVRPPAVYGPGDRGTLPLIKELTRPIAVIPGRRDARFSLIHVRDLARILATATEGGGHGLHEVSDGKPNGYSWSDLLAAAGESEGRRIKPVFLPRSVPYSVAVFAEAWFRISGKPGMVSRGKIRELYHPDWVCRDGSLKLDDPIPFITGFSETVTWYRAAGWLPQRMPADRTAAKL
jgi:nucleoside-diphosphate-sugar epimerase